MGKDTISVIVPVYNIARDLPRCVDSVRNQSYGDLELILVDDGSTDGSGEICDGYARQDGRVRVLHQKNAGVSAARNAGVALAAGDYITFVDSDDYLELDIYEKMAKAMTEENLDIAACGFFYDDTPVQMFDREEIVQVSPEQAIRDVITDQPDSVFCGAVWNKLYRTEALKRQLVFDPGLLMGEDMLVTLQCLTAAGRIGYVSCCGYHYVQRQTSMVHSYKKNKCSSAAAHERMRELLQKADPQLCPLIEQRSIRQNCCLLMEQMIGDRYYPEDVKVLLDSTRKYRSQLNAAGLSRKELFLLKWMLYVPGGAAMLRAVYRIRK